MVPRESLIDWLNSIQWQQPAAITDEAMTLIKEHLEKIRKVIRHIMVVHNINASEAHGIAQTAGHFTSEYEELLDELFNQVNFEGTGVREPIILAVSACYCWDFESDLKNLPNPWIPLIELIGMGYTISNEDSSDGEKVSLRVGHQDGIDEFLIV